MLLQEKFGLIWSVPTTPRRIHNQRVCLSVCLFVSLFLLIFVCVLKSSASQLSSPELYPNFDFHHRTRFYACQQSSIVHCAMCCLVWRLDAKEQSLEEGAMHLWAKVPPNPSHRIWFYACQQSSIVASGRSTYIKAFVNYFHFIILIIQFDTDYCKLQAVPRVLLTPWMFENYCWHWFLCIKKACQNLHLNHYGNKSACCGAQIVHEAKVRTRLRIGTLKQEGWSYYHHWESGHFAYTEGRGLRRGLCASLLASPSSADWGTKWGGGQRVQVMKRTTLRWWVGQYESELRYIFWLWGCSLKMFGL